MNCTSLLTSGFTLDCNDGIGGIQDIYIGNFSEVDSFVEGAGVVTSISQTAAKSIYKYELEQGDADGIFTETKSTENGTLFYSNLLNFTIDRITAAKNVELELMAKSRALYVIWTDNKGVHWGIGLDKGAKKVGGTNQAATGKAWGDKTGYTIGLTAMETHLPYEIDAASFASLTIA